MEVRDIIEILDDLKELLRSEGENEKIDIINKILGWTHPPSYLMDTLYDYLKELQLDFKGNEKVESLIDEAFKSIDAWFYKANNPIDANNASADDS